MVALKILLYTPVRLEEITARKNSRKHQKKAKKICVYKKKQYLCSAYRTPLFGVVT